MEPRTRSRKKSSAVPLVVGVAAVGLLAMVAVIVATSGPAGLSGVADSDPDHKKVLRLLAIEAEGTDASYYVVRWWPVADVNGYRCIAVKISQEGPFGRHASKRVFDVTGQYAKTTSEYVDAALKTKDYFPDPK